MPSEKTKAKALDALDGMASIARREMLVRGTYIEDTISNPRMVGAICGGRRHCAIGSLWTGAGIKPVKGYRNEIDLPGIAQSERDEFLLHRPGLRLAYDALNSSAKAFAERKDLKLLTKGRGGRVNGLYRYTNYSAAVEALFEGHYGTRLTKRDLLSVIASAKRIVRKA